MLKSFDLSRINKILLFTVLIGIILHYGREFFVLLSFSGFLAMLMAPVSRWLERHKISRVLSSIISVFIILAVILGVVALLSAQFASIIEELPYIVTGFEEILEKMQFWINDHLGISSDEQVSTLMDKASELMSSAGSFLTDMVTGTFTFIGSFLLVIVFTFLFLLQREKYENFVVKLSNPEKRDETRRIMRQISKVAQQYLGGRLISIFILAILYILGFSVIGLNNAILLGGIAAIITFIPYIGPVLGGLLPFFLAIIAGSFNQALWVVAIISASQLFDNYFIEPYVVGGSVNISPFFAIFILILGGVVWGIAGVILFLPLLGILKIIFENVEGLEPYAYLVGDQKESSTPQKIIELLRSFFSRKRGNSEIHK